VSSEKNNSLEELTSKMVHDVRTPLTILNMIAYTMEEKLKNDPDGQEQLRIMKEELPKIDKIVSEYREQIRPLF
jgi:signal transduction histidine kinase